MLLASRISIASCIVAPTPTSHPVAKPKSMASCFRTDAGSAIRPNFATLASDRPETIRVGSDNTCPPPSGVRVWPAQKARSAEPVKITARTLSSASISSHRRNDLLAIGAGIGVHLVRAFSVMVEIPSAFSTMIWVVSVMQILSGSCVSGGSTQPVGTHETCPEAENKPVKRAVARRRWEGQEGARRAWGGLG